MVTCGGHRADAIDTSRKSTGDSSRESAVSVTSIVDTLEEHELSGIRRRLGVERANILDSDVGVANDLAVLESLGSSVVGVLRVRKGASNKILNFQVNREVRVCWDKISRFRLRDDSRNHIAGRRNLSHDCEMVRMHIL